MLASLRARILQQGKRDQASRARREQGRKADVSLRAPASTPPSLDITNDIFNIHKVKKLS